jgi:acyl-CoA thioesterase-1
MMVGGAMSSDFSARAQAKALRIIALGDSLTAGYLLPARAAFPVVLERALRAAGHDVEVVNAGVSGDTATAALDRFDWAIGDGAEAMIVELGANDMFRGLDPEVTYRALREIISRAQTRGMKVLIAGMLADRGLGKDYRDKFEAIFPRLAAETSSLLYPFFLDGVVTDRALIMQDGIHPTAAGVEKIVDGILPKVVELVKSVALKP